MKLQHLLLTCFLSMLSFGLIAQSKSLQSFQNNVDGITKSNDSKEKKKEKIADALKSYSASLKKKGNKQVDETISRDQLDEILNILKGASAKIDPENVKSDDMPKGFAMKTREQCLAESAFSTEGIFNAQCVTANPWHGMSGIVIIFQPSPSCAAYEYYGDYCRNLQ